MPKTPLRLARSHQGRLDAPPARARVVRRRAAASGRGSPSPHPDIRHDALRFLGDEDAVAWWGQQLGVDGALQHQVQAALREGHARQ